MATVSSLSDATMKKFGRGFSLDFDALMNEVGRPSSQQGDEGGHRRTPGLDSTEAGPSTTRTYGRFNSYGSEDAISPVVDPSTPTDDGSPDPGGRIIGSGTQTRVSVSRTGRCKNRNRQRLSVLQDEDFFRAAPPPSSSDAAGKAVKTPSSSSTVAASPTASVAAAAGEAIDFDSVLNALDKSIQAPASVMAADCYSF